LLPAPLDTGPALLYSGNSKEGGVDMHDKQAATAIVNGREYRITQGHDNDTVEIDTHIQGRWYWIGNGRWSDGGEIYDCSAILPDHVYTALEEAFSANLLANK
jgi:hypothetical protein